MIALGFSVSTITSRSDYSVGHNSYFQDFSYYTIYQLGTSSDVEATSEVSATSLETKI